MSRPKLVHRCGRRCSTERLFPSPLSASPPSGVQPELVVDMFRGKLPLWSPGTALNWRFDERALARHDDPDTMRRKVRGLFRDAVAAWEDAAPVIFKESRTGWDFEIAVLRRPDCEGDVCTLARAFFPLPVRQRLMVYPSMFEWERAEQVATMVHELGHVFGLRHFFADTDPDELEFPSYHFGSGSRFTIMNYGYESRLTEADRRDLRRLYQAAWADDAEAILGKPVKLVSAPHAARRGRALAGEEERP